VKEKGGVDSHRLLLLISMDASKIFGRSFCSQDLTFSRGVLKFAVQLKLIPKNTEFEIESRITFFDSFHAISSCCLRSQTSHIDHASPSPHQQVAVAWNHGTMPRRLNHVDSSL
jgi:hypothetical protein